MRYANKGHTSILIDDGRLVPVDPRNNDYIAIMAAGVPIAPWVNSALIAEAKSSVLAFATAAADQITGPVPEAEKLGWLKKEQAARDCQSGTASQSQIDFLIQEAAITGEDLNTLCTKIVERAEIYAKAVGMIAGFRRRTMKAIDDLGQTPTEEQVEQVLQAAKAEASVALQQILNGG